MDNEFEREFRVMVYFKEDAPKSYTPRSYNGKVVHDTEQAESLLAEAKSYYSRCVYARYVDRVIIESRWCAPWRSDNA